jgi:hypothetical protein
MLHPKMLNKCVLCIILILQACSNVEPVKKITVAPDKSGPCFFTFYCSNKGNSFRVLIQGNELILALRRTEPNLIDHYLNNFNYDQNFDLKVSSLAFDELLHYSFKSTNTIIKDSTLKNLFDNYRKNNVSLYSDDEIIMRLLKDTIYTRKEDYSGGLVIAKISRKKFQEKYPPC